MGVKGQIAWNKNLKGWTKGTKAGFQKGHSKFDGCGAPKGIHNSPNTEFKKGIVISHRKGCQCFRCDKKVKDKNINWNNGNSFEPYGLEFNENLREVIRNRDRRKCQICEITELENSRKLDIHHTDYNKQNNNPNNLISLCNKCHLKTNSNRNNWINYFKI